MNSVGSCKYYSEIDILKGVAILTVVLEHAFAVKYINLTEIGWCYHTVEVIKSFNMQLFFAISGFLFANSKQYDIRKAFKGKFDRLLVPMLFFAAISLFLSIFLSSYFSSETTVSKSMLIDWFVYGECNWFVYTLLVIFCLMIPFKKRLTPALVIGISLALIVLKELGLVHARIFQIHHVLYMLVFFFLGYLTYVYYDVVRPFISKWYICGLCIVGYVFLYQIKEVSFVRNWALPITLGTGLWGG